MRLRLLLALVAFPSFMLAVATSQPPKEGKEKAPPKLEPGKMLPSPLRQALELTEEQAQKLDAIEKAAYEKLLKVLTQAQRQQMEELATKGPGRGLDPKGPTRRETTPLPRPILPPGPRILNPAKLDFLASPQTPDVHFTLTGDAAEGDLGDWRKEHSGRGIRFLSGEDSNRDGKSFGSASWMAKGINAKLGRWYRFRADVLVQDGFQVPQGELYLDVEFFKDNGKNPLDHIKKSVLEQIERQRKDFLDPATNKSLGHGTWRSVAIEFRTPFTEIDALRLSIGFVGGRGTRDDSELWVREIELTPIPDPKEYLAPTKGEAKQPLALKSLVNLGGRWYYDPRGEKTEIPKQFDHTNVDRLYYLTDRLEAPFAGNVSSWLRRGYLDRDGNVIEKDRFIPDAVTISFTNQHLVMRSRNLPNHPTAVFPDRTRFLDGNPNSIREQNYTWYLPLEPKENPNHIAMKPKNENRALPMGPIGVAVNGVVFFNPFDESNEIDAVWRLDRCCGHPSPGQEYHYHKYPVCTNTSWNDDGESHSPLIGFAFDGFPVYGPYEAAGEMAKDSKKNPLNDFNLHFDEARGFHYHVTPGQSPHLIGGFWGELDARNRGKKGGKKN